VSQVFRVSRTSILYSTIIKATTDAANELLLHQGFPLEEASVDAIGSSKGAEYQSALKTTSLSELDIQTITDAYTEQWIDIYNYLQKKMSKMSQG